MTLLKQLEWQLEKDEAIWESLGYQLMDNLNNGKFQKIADKFYHYERLIDETREQIEQIIKDEEILKNRNNILNSTEGKNVD